MDADRPQTIDEVVVMCDFRAAKPNMLDLLTGDTVYVLQKSENGWWDGCVQRSDGFARGWFPSNYTKSRQQIALEDHQASGSRPGGKSNINSILRHNLEEPKRKDSSLSLHSDHSQRSKHSLPKPQQWVTAQEAEAMYSAAGLGKVPVWIPQALNDGTVVYYNSELNVHCRELPYFQNPEVDEDSTIGIPRHSAVSTLIDTDSAAGISPFNTGARPSTLTMVNESPSYSQPRASASRSSVRSGGTNTTTVHPWNTSLYCVPDLFYYDPTDITTWPALRDAFCYFLTLTLDALVKKNGPGFYTYFNIASRLGVLVNLAARLAQHDLQKSGYQNRVQRRLKKMSSSIAQVGIHGNLHLTEYPQTAPLSPSVSNAATDRNFSTVTQDTVKPDETDANDVKEDPDKIEQYTGEEGDGEELNFQINYLQKCQTEIESLKRNAISVVKVFVQISSTNFNEQALLPQVYPRFLTGFFSGGNWRNPFVPEPQDPFSGKEVVKSLHQRRVETTVLNKETCDLLEKKKEQLSRTLDDVLTALKSKENAQTRNVEVLSKVHKSLSLSAKFIDLLEGLDFSVFLKTQTGFGMDDENEDLEDLFDPTKMIYPILTEFFEAKQEIRDVFVSIIMEAQSLTLPDPTVFRSIREDEIGAKPATQEPEKTAKQLERELQKIDVECDDGISIDVDHNLEVAIVRSHECLEVCIALVAQLVSEREAYLNYATRVMDPDGFFDLMNPAPVHTTREDSTMTAADEYALPASARGRYNRYGQSEDVDVPWYLSTEEYELIFTANDAVKGGTREALVQRLTHHDLLDAHFNVAFLTSFRSMLTTTALVNALIKRFKIEPPENLSYEEYSDWVAKKAYPVKLRVVNIVKSLLQKHWNPAYNEPGLYRILGDFIDELLVQSFPGSEQLKREFDRKVTPEPYHHKDVKPPRDEEENLPINPKTRKMKLLDIDPQELANQLTLRESKLYNNITQSECLAKSWGTKYGSLGGYPHLQKFIANSNDLTNWVSTQILSYNDSKSRVAVIKYFVTVAEKCRLLNNFSSMTAILSALYSSPIHRLKKTWKLVPPTTMSSMHTMNSLMNSSRNFAEYREHLRFIADKPCVPFLGVFLSDLTFITNGNPDVLHGDPKLVNFAKRAKTVEILREISRYQSMKYNVKKHDEVQEYIRFHFKNVLGIEEQYTRSLQIEPRVKVAQQIQQQQQFKAEPKHKPASTSFLKTLGGMPPPT